MHNTLKIIVLYLLLASSGLIAESENDAKHKAEIRTVPESCAFDPWHYARPFSPKHFPSLSNTYRGQLFRILAFVDSESPGNFECRLIIRGPQGGIYDDTSVRKEINEGVTLINTLVYEIVFTDKHPLGNYNATLLATNEAGQTVRADTVIQLSEFVALGNFEDREGYGEWLNQFYRHPDAAEATAAFLYMADLPFNWESIEENSLMYLQTAFYDTVFLSNKWVVPHVTSIFTTAYPEIRKRITFLYGRIGYKPETLFAQLNNDIRKFADWAEKLKLPDSASGIVTGMHVDMDWARFFASGRYEHVRRIAELLNPQERNVALNALKTINREELLESVKWSLESNCANHPLVAAYCRYISEDESMSKEARDYLKSILP